MKKPSFTLMQSFNLFKDFLSDKDHKRRAYLLLIGSIVCVVALVALMSGISWCMAAFFEALTAKALASFLICIQQFALLVGAYVGVNALQNYCMKKLSILWRTWLTKKVTDQLFNSENNYKELKRLSDIDNYAQRIQQDIKDSVTLSLSLSMDFLKSLLSLGTFIGTLWVIGGPLTITLLGLNLVIPGYLVWVALASAIAATVATNFIGKPLSTLNKDSEKLEADLRQDLTHLDQESENISEEHAEPWYQKKLAQKINEINTIENKKLDVETKVLSFQSFYTEFIMILPHLLAAPLYFSGLIQLGQLMQVGMAFGQVSIALNWFVNSYQSLADYKSSVDRVNELQNKFEGEAIHANNKGIDRKIRNKSSIKIKGLTIKKPQAEESTPIVENIDLKIHAYPESVCNLCSVFGSARTHAPSALKNMESGS